MVAERERQRERGERDTERGRERERVMWPGVLDGSRNIQLRDTASPWQPCREGARGRSAQSLLPSSLPPVPVGVPTDYTQWGARGQGA